MIGHQRVIEMRLQGQRPDLLTIIVTDEVEREWIPRNPTAGELAWLEFQRRRYADVQTGGTAPHDADLRFLTGLHVDMTCRGEVSPETFDAWVAAVAECKPSLLVMLDPTGAFATWKP